MLQGRYERLKKIGEGSFGVVYKAVDHYSKTSGDMTVKPSMEMLAKALSSASIATNNSENKDPNPAKEECKMTAGEMKKGKLVAIKKLHVMDDEISDKVHAREIEFLKKLNHPNVVKLYEVFKKGQNLYMVLEYFDTDLEKIISSAKSPLPVSEIKNYMKQILECAAYLHDNKIMHRDFKPSNMFVSKDGSLKCGDFGIARFFAKDKKDMLTKAICTRYSFTL